MKGREYPAWAPPAIVAIRRRLPHEGPLAGYDLPAEWVADAIDRLLEKSYAEDLRRAWKAIPDPLRLLDELLLRTREFRRIPRVTKSKRNSEVTEIAKTARTLANRIAASRFGDWNGPADRLLREPLRARLRDVLDDHLDLNENRAASLADDIDDAINRAIPGLARLLRRYARHLQGITAEPWALKQPNTAGEEARYLAERISAFVTSETGRPNDAEVATVVGRWLDVELDAEQVRKLRPSAARRRARTADRKKMP